MKSRLKRNHECMKKTASYYVSLHSIVLGSGDYIEFQAKLMANRPWYMIVQDSRFDLSSYYDGQDFERAFDMYVEIVLAFKGVAAAEQIRKLKPDFLRRSNQLVAEKDADKYKDMYQCLKRNPLFLGISDF